MGAINNALLERALEDSSQGWQPELSLLARHDVYFETRLADSPSILEAAHHLRYQVYCVERKFESAEQHHNGQEIDQYDRHAIQGVLYHRPTDRAIGTVRMILPADCGMGRLPIENFLRGNDINLSAIVDIERSVEVSRFAISKEFRRRWTDDLLLARHSLSPQDAARQGNLAFLSLVQFFLRESIERRVLYWTAVMEPMLLRMLDRMGIHFRPIGPVVNHHGLRQPAWSYIPTVLDELKFEHRDYWEVVTNGGELSQRLAVLMPTPRAVRNRA